MVERSQAWLLFPKGARAQQGLSNAGARGRSLLAVRNPTPSALEVLMKFAEQQNKL
jgi:hypothetical protein